MVPSDRCGRFHPDRGRTSAVGALPTSLDRAPRSTFERDGSASHARYGRVYRALGRARTVVATSQRAYLTSSPTKSRSLSIAAMPKRSSFDWASKTDPDTGAQLRFCARCQDFRPLDRFYQCHLKRRVMLCKAHEKSAWSASKRKWRNKNRGERGSNHRLLRNVNQFIYRKRIRSGKWSMDTVEAALRHHAVDLTTETRTVVIRPLDETLPFTVSNSVVRFRKNRAEHTE